MNTQAIEIELRYTIISAQELAPFLAPLTKLHQKRDIDLYLDTPQQPYIKGSLFLSRIHSIAKNPLCKN